MPVCLSNVVMMVRFWVSGVSVPVLVDVVMVLHPFKLLEVAGDISGVVKAVYFIYTLGPALLGVQLSHPLLHGTQSLSTIEYRRGHDTSID